MNKNPSLTFCLVMDFIGYGSYSIPFLGELSGVVWAPLSAIIFFFAFGGRKAIFGSAFSFAEEILPFTDFIPTFTIAWLWRRFTSRETEPRIISVKSTT